MGNLIGKHTIEGTWRDCGEEWDTRGRVFRRRKENTSGSCPKKPLNVFGTGRPGAGHRPPTVSRPCKAHMLRYGGRINQKELAAV